MAGVNDILPYAHEDAGSPPSLFPDYRSTVLRSPRQPAIRIPQTLTETTGPGACWERLMVKAPPSSQKFLPVTGRNKHAVCHKEQYPPLLEAGGS